MDDPKDSLNRKLRRASLGILLIGLLIGLAGVIQAGIGVSSSTGALASFNQGIGITVLALFVMVIAGFILNGLARRAD